MPTWALAWAGNTSGKSAKDTVLFFFFSFCVGEANVDQHSYYGILHKYRAYLDLLTLSPGLAPVLHISSCAASNPPTALPSVVEAISLVQRAIESG